MATYNIEPERRTLHGKFSRDMEPLLTVEPGDTVVYRTLDAGWGLEPPTSIEGTRRKFEPLDAERDGGHAMCGPVAVRGAEPGMALEVRINEVVPGAWGSTYAGGWRNETNERLGVTEKGILFTWELDAEKLIGRNQHGHEVALRPFMGVMGLPPDEPGLHSTTPPRTCGGNIDCKELVEGSTLYLPVTVPGALFSVGDGHAVQGDGEVSTTAIECPMERVSLTFGLRDDMRLTTPRAHTEAGWITFGFHEDLNEATIIALEGMLLLLGEQHGLERLEALAMASLLVDMRITQIVNQVKGVHAVLPHGAIR